MKPAVSGMPAKDSRNKVKVSASSGWRLPSPVHWVSVVASAITGPPGPSLTSRTRVTMANAPIVARP